MRVHYISALSLLGILAAGTAHAQIQQNAAPSDTVFRATTRLVQVDVVVTDASGNPIKDLTEKDFSLLEDGKPQKVASVSLVQVDGASQQIRPAPPALPPNVVTNRPEYQAPLGPPVVLVFDGLNTAVQNQMYVRQEMLKYLAEHFNPHVRMAVFALGNDLAVLQDFTSDPAVLAIAIQKYRSQAAAAGRQAETDPMQAATFAGPNIPARGTGSTDSGSPEPSNSRSLANIAGALARFEKESAASVLEMRIAKTMDALSALARYLAGFPGRKSVIWFSGSFPLNLSLIDPQDFDVYRSYAGRIRDTTNLLSDAHVAIYAVDARGLVGTSISDPSQSGRDASGRMKLTVSEEMRANSKEVFDRFDKEDSLVKVAEETGGRAYLNTNDMERAVQVSIRDDSSYYVLGYYPSRKQWDGKFRTIRVKVDRDGVSVRHRRGYYASDPEEWKRNSAGDMKAALANNTVVSTEVLFYARALPPAAAEKGEVKVEFLVDAHTITFQTAAENQHYCSLEFQVQAFGNDGKLARAQVQQAEAPLKEATYERIQQSGLPMPVTIKLPDGDYMLRLGVRDNHTGLFGTAVLPLSIHGSGK